MTKHKGLTARERRVADTAADLERAAIVGYLRAFAASPFASSSTQLLRDLASHIEGGGHLKHVATSEHVEDEP